MLVGIAFREPLRLGTTNFILLALQVCHLDQHFFKKYEQELGPNMRIT